MRTLLLAIALLWPAASAEAEALWVGNARLTHANECGSTATVGDYWRATYRPKGTGFGNGANSHFSLVSQRSSFVMRVPNNDFQFGVNYVGQSVSSTLSVTSMAGGVLSWSESTPVGNGPQALTLTASIANFYGRSGCTGTFDVYLIRLP